MVYQLESISWTSVVGLVDDAWLQCDTDTHSSNNRKRDYKPFKL